MKKNFRKALSLLTVTAMAASLAACGGSTPAPETTAAAAETEAAAEESKAEDAPEAEAPAEAAGDEGKVLNIWCWNDEFQSRFNDYYPEVKEVSADKSTTTLNDGTIVKWTINPNQDNNYQNKLDEALLNQEAAAADDKIDIFLIEADYALKYVGHTEGYHMAGNTGTVCLQKIHRKGCSGHR